jgi:predicted XRE-type DNA-binding protein
MRPNAPRALPYGMPAPHDPIPALKHQIAAAVVAELDGWTQPMAAELLRTDQPRVSDLRNGKLQRFSLERLIRFAAQRGATVSLEITWPRFPFR